MKKAKFPILYISIFVCVLGLLWLFLALSAAIPNELLADNMKKSALYYKEKDAFSFENGEKWNAVSDNYADAILLNISNNMGDGNPFVASLDTKYYDGEEMGEAAGFYLSLMQDTEPNADYSRYWHGSAMLIRPLHLFASVSQIKTIGLLAILILALVCTLLLIKRRHTALAIAFVLSLVSVHIWNIRLSLEYQPAFIICMAMCILYLILEQKGDIYLTCLSVAGGALTAFFDFLTTETITILVPLILVIAVRTKENRIGSFKDSFYLILKCSMLWLMAYGGTFIAKWALATIVTGENKFITALFSAGDRFGGALSSQGVTNPILQIILAPFANLTMLFGGEQRLDMPRVFICLVIVALILGSLVYLLGKKPVDKASVKLLTILGIVVFARYMLLSNHSYLHEFFTYRALISPIMAVFSVIALTISKNN